MVAALVAQLDAMVALVRHAAQRTFPRVEREMSVVILSGEVWLRVRVEGGERGGS